MDSEKKIEVKLRDEVKKMGGFALKWVSPGNNGVPDRIVIMPSAHIWFIELKSEGKTLRPLQIVWKKILTRLGFQHREIDTLNKLNIFLHEVRSTQLPGKSL